MARFVFRLEQVLQYRTQLEDQAKMEFAQARAEHDREQQCADVLAAELDAAMRKRHEASRASRDEAWLAENYCRGVAGDLKASRARVAHLAVVLEGARQKLVQAMQERKLLDTLKEKQYARYLKEERQNEQRFNDEITTIRARPAAG